MPVGYISLEEKMEDGQYGLVAERRAPEWADSATSCAAVAARRSPIPRRGPLMRMPGVPAWKRRQAWLPEQQAMPQPEREAAVQCRVGGAQRQGTVSKAMVEPTLRQSRKRRCH